MALSYRELSAVATMVMRQYEERACEAVAERIGLFALLNDADGLETWHAVAARVDLLSRPAPQL